MGSSLSLLPRIIVAATVVQQCLASPVLHTYTTSRSGSTSSGKDGHESSPSPLSTFAHTLRKPFRDARFWSQVVHIYSSYKCTQVQSLIDGLWKKRPMTNDQSSTIVDPLWEKTHEINSNRMMNLCLDLRGFYLKTGQFLGTRHDFMPPNYTSKLSKLHDDVPPLTKEAIQKVLERELGGPVNEFFDEIDLDKPIGSASVAQVHIGKWKATGEKCAVKVQYPNAERVMVSDLKNLRFLAEFLQRTELKFDVLSAIKELQKRIVNEFDFHQEAKNMDFVRTGLSKSMSSTVVIPRPIVASRKALIMSFVEGDNLCKLAEFRDKTGSSAMPLWLQKRYGSKLLKVLAKAWGEQIFDLRTFQADPHPGNICINKKNGKIGLLDWGQVKTVSDTLAVNFALMVEAMNTRKQDNIVHAFHRLGVEVSNSQDKESIANIAVTMLDTRIVPGYVMDPFNPESALKKNAVSKMPSDLYFVVRTVQLLRGISSAFNLDFSLSEVWAPYASRTLRRHPELVKQANLPILRHPYK